MFPDNKKLLRFATTFHKCFKVHPLENSKWINERTQLRFLKSIPSFIPKLLWVPDGFFWRAAGQCFGVGRRPTNETFLAPKVNQTAHKLHPSAPPKPVWPKRGSAQELRLTGNFIFSARKPRTSAKKAPECCCCSLIFFFISVLVPIQTSNFTCAELNARVKCMWSATFESFKFDCLNLMRRLPYLRLKQSKVRLLIQTSHFTYAELH